VNTYQHGVFLERVVRPARQVLNGRPLHRWMEDMADELASGSRLWQRPDFGLEYLQALQVTELRKVPPGDANWQASIRLDKNGHELSVTNLQAPNQRALVAHELGHALLYMHQELWASVTKTKLLVDPANERLVDDIARCLLVPRLVISQFADDMPINLSTNVWNSRISEAVCNSVLLCNAPVRIVLSRFAQMALNSKSIILHITAPLQRDFFDDSTSSKRSITRWLINYTPKIDQFTGEMYPFIDFVPIRKSFGSTLFDEISDFKSGDIVHSNLLTKLIPRSLYSELHEYDCVRVLCSFDAYDQRHIALVGM
jgi:hypothetical protein